MKALIKKIKNYVTAHSSVLVNTRYYSKEEVENLLKQQRELCGDRMDEWCVYNNLKKCRHIVEYATCPDLD